MPGFTTGLKAVLSDTRRLSIAVFSLFSPWMLSFAFEGQILYSLSAQHGINPYNLVFGSAAGHLVGLILCGFLVTNLSKAKKMMILSLTICSVLSTVFFLAPSALWNISLVVMCFMYGVCLASWSFYLRGYTPAELRTRTMADGIIYSNVLMIALNMIAIYMSPRIGLLLTILMLVAAAILTAKLPEIEPPPTTTYKFDASQKINLWYPLAFLCIFIGVITINSGLMYHVINPAFEHLQWLTSWYWAVPYIGALYVVKMLPERTNQTYVLYVAIAMIGFSFVFFMVFGRSVANYLLVDTLMLGACGVCDLFWWSILGEMLDLYNNAATIFGVGLAANVMGILSGALLGKAMTLPSVQAFAPSALALIVVFVILIILPLLHKQLSSLLKQHSFLTALSGLAPDHQNNGLMSLRQTNLLTDREVQIASLLLKGNTYKMISEELFLSQNTVKTHIKNLYSKLGIGSRTELIKLTRVQK